jgi:predicted transcriptional regulator
MTLLLGNPDAAPDNHVHPVNPDHPNIWCDRRVIAEMSRMKAKTSVALSKDLLASVDKLAGPRVSRSAYIEQILREFVDQRAKAQKDAREVALINRHAARLNVEMSDVLSFGTGTLRTARELLQERAGTAKPKDLVKFLRRAPKVAPVTGDEIP